MNRSLSTYDRINIDFFFMTAWPSPVKTGWDWPGHRPNTLTCKIQARVWQLIFKNWSINRFWHWTGSGIQRRHRVRSGGWAVVKFSGQWFGIRVFHLKIPSSKLLVSVYCSVRMLFNTLQRSPAICLARTGHGSLKIYKL